MSERTEILEELAKPDGIVSKIAFPAKREYHSSDSSATIEPVPYGGSNEAPHSITTTGLPRGLSFFTIPQRSGTYPDTAESGETYEVEVSIDRQDPRLIAPVGDYSG